MSSNEEHHDDEEHHEYEEHHEDEEHHDDEEHHEKNKPVPIKYKYHDIGDKTEEGHEDGNHEDGNHEDGNHESKDVYIISDKGTHISSGWEFPHGIKFPEMEGEDCNAFTCGNDGWCLPLWIYMLVALLGLLGFIFSSHSSNYVLMYLIFWLFVIALISTMMYNFCKKGHVGWSWVLLIIPLVLQLFWTGIVSFFGIGFYRTR